MPLNIVVNQGTIPAPRIVSPQEVVRRAQERGNTGSSIALAYTDPILKIDQTGLHYRQRRGVIGYPEFQFDNCDSDGG